MKTNWAKILEPFGRAWYWTTKGKFTLRPGAGQSSGTPWLHNPLPIVGQKEEAGFDCGVLQMFHQALGKKVVHSFCMECYKVVVMPETLEQVHKIADFQNIQCYKWGWPCKVGAELREYTQRKWGAYWYCRGVEEGRERYKAIRKWVDENLGKDIKVILKRGCTEFEQAMGDSDKWKKHPDQDELEKEFSSFVQYDYESFEQAAAIKHRVWDFWDSWDKLNRPPVTYHEEGE